MNDILLDKSDIIRKNQPIQLGLCCMNMTLKENKPPIYASRTMTQKRLLELIKTEGKKFAMKELKKRILLNLDDLIIMIKWNEKHKIKVFRLTSDLFPHKGNIKVPNYTYQFAKEKLKKIGKLAKKYNQRLTFHPGQYNVVGTPHKNVFDATCRELKYHADVLDLIGTDKNSVIVVHGGGLYGDKKDTMERWCKNFKRLPKNVQERLVLENCERIFNIEDCLQISNCIGIPVVFDTHHHDCYISSHEQIKLHNASYYIKDILLTWSRRGIKPKFHVSEQARGKRLGAHSKYIEKLPDYLLEIPKKYNVDIDIMIEAKNKELAIKKLYGNKEYKKYLFKNK